MIPNRFFTRHLRSRHVRNLEAIRSNSRRRNLLIEQLEMRLPLAAEIAVFDGLTAITDGGSLNFGSATPGTALLKTLTVRNSGDANLTLTPLVAASFPAGYSLVSNFADTDLSPSEATTFGVQLSSPSNGSFSGSISFANTDSDENPFDLSLSGVVAPAPVIMDDGDVGYSSSGAWTTHGVGGFQNDYQYSTSGAGNDVATWTFNVSPGRYKVSTTWFPHPNRATNSPFQIFNGSARLNTVNINQELAPNDFNDGGAAWENLAGPYDISANTLVVRLADNANEFVIADAVRIERIGDIILAPEITVTNGSINLTDGGTLNLGSTTLGVAVDKTVTIKNDGAANLTLTPINAAILPTGVTLASNIGSATLAPNASTSFTLRLESATARTINGALAFNNNDSDENPFNLSFSGVVATIPVIIDDGDAGYSSTGAWTTHGVGGFQSDYQYSSSGPGNDVATWTFNVSPGRYKVAATWFPHPNRATNTSFQIFNGSTPLNTVNINQELAPNDFNDGGAAWENLAGPYDTSANTLVVRLTDNANEFVIADAIRIERMGDIVVGPEIAVQDGSVDVTDGGTLNLGNTLPGVALDKTISIRNEGTANLTLTPIDGTTLPAGISLVSNIGAASLAPNAATTFTLRLQSATSQTFTGALAFASNDSDENPFNLNFTGVVAAAPAVAILDDGDNGYSSSGAWTIHPVGGFQSDYQYSTSGPGNDVANWTFSVTPGRYRIAATWFAHPNRATNAPFRIFNGSTLLNTVNINQESTPNDFNDSGAAWENLAGPYDISASTLVVRLADNANEYVIADAIRIERVGDLVVEPEIAVSDESGILANGGTLNLGSTTPGVSLDKTITIQNDGTASLTLTPINAATLPSGISLVSNIGVPTLAPNAATTFKLRLQSATTQTITGALSFANNDSDENPFILNLTGSISTTPAVAIIVDDGDTGYISGGEWTAHGVGGFESDYQYSSAGPGSDVATWTFDVTPGRYRVAATWFPHPNRATNSPFRIFNGSTLLNTATTNQELTPNDFSDAGAAWENLAGPYDISTNNLIVRLADSANEFVIADAIRVERIGDLPGSLAEGEALANVSSADQRTPWASAVDAVMATM